MERVRLTQQLNEPQLFYYRECVEAFEASYADGKLAGSPALFFSLTTALEHFQKSLEALIEVSLNAIESEAAGAVTLAVDVSRGQIETRSGTASAIDSRIVLYNGMVLSPVDVHAIAKMAEAGYVKYTRRVLGGQVKRAGGLLERLNAMDVPKK